MTQKATFRPAVGDALIGDRDAEIVNVSSADGGSATYVDLLVDGEQRNHVLLVDSFDNVPDDCDREGSFAITVEADREEQPAEIIAPATATTEQS